MSLRDVDVSPLIFYGELHRNNKTQNCLNDFVILYLMDRF